MTSQPAEPKKYYYRTDVKFCVLCGIEDKERYRVYNKNEAGVHASETACSNHF